MQKVPPSDESPDRAAKSAGLIRLSRSYGGVVLGVLTLLAVAALFVPSSNPIIAPPMQTIVGGSPKVEGRPVESLFGLDQGLMRYEVKKRAKPYVGKVVRISGVVKDVQSPTPEMKFAGLQGAGGVSLMFRVQFEPDFASLAPGRAIKAACVYRGEITPNSIQFEDCRFTP